MARFDRYLLSQLLMLFGFFALILVAIYWINSAVRLFDQLIGDGQTAWVFLEYSALTLPNVFRISMPIAVFVASVYVTNRLSAESELVVMRATGFSPWRLARPVLVFGLLVALLMSVMTHFLVPMSKRQISLRNDEISRNVTARMLTEGTFLHPADGITFYIREITEDGTLLDVFLSDRREPEQPQTFSAARAYIINAAEPGADPEPKLVMTEGLVQTLRQPGERLFVTHFQDFTYDISALMDQSEALIDNAGTLPTWTLLLAPDAVEALSGDSPGIIAEEAHDRFANALLCVVAALLGFAALQVGGFSRFGVWKQILFAVGIIVLIKFIEGLVTGPVRADAALWPLMYLPGGTGIAISAMLLWWATRPHRIRGGRGPALAEPAAS